MKVAELFDRLTELVDLEPSRAARRFLHETLVLACTEALRDTRQGFGNLFSQVDYLCKRHGIAMRDRIAIQQMRRHSNGHGTLSGEEWLYDLRALALFVSAVFRTAIPHQLTTRLPATTPPADPHARVNQRYLRCIVTSWDNGHLSATTSDGPIDIRYDDDILPTLLTEGMQLNLLDCVREGTTVTPGLVVVEPDFLVDISSVAACFQDYGHHPLSYLLNRIKPRVSSQPVLLGNFAGSALDALIHQPDFDFGTTLRDSFREQALQFCTCEGFDPSRFKEDCRRQVENLREAVDILFGEYDRSRALLEPSFVCEKLGLQGRVDLMTDDMRLLVEQKSGKKWNSYQESHYVQLLLYYGVLRYNFQLSSDQVDIRLLYSKYPAREGLLVINFYQKLFREAIALRNRIVAQEIRIAREGFRTVLPELRSSLLLENQWKAGFFDRYIRPEADQVLQALHHLSATEADYVERMMTFVYREQLAQKTGVQEGQGGAQSDLWNMPFSEKQETGNIIVGVLTDWNSHQVTLQTDSSSSVPNFRRGDMVYLYQYEEDGDVRTHLLYKGVLDTLSDSQATLHLNDAQHNPNIFHAGTYAIEHASSDIGTTSAIRSIHAFCNASQSRRDLLLGLSAPRCNATLQLSRSYHPHYDAMLLKAKQACDYFLLQGPPGTGKTSMALRFLVEEELSSAADGHSSILLTAYTHRAVDEICSMLSDAAIDYLRLGSEASCNPRFTHHLLDHALGDSPKLAEIRQRLTDAPVIVSTTATLLSRPFLLQLKPFSLCIVDEASQILEPNIIGLLASERVDRFILIGDHKQLPAVVQQPDDEPRLHDCRQSLFERLLRQEQQAGRTTFTAVLRHQGRMHPDIARFPNELFYRREQLKPVPLPHQEETALQYPLPSEDAVDDLLKQHRVLFFPCDSPSPADAPLSDKVNTAEAMLVADLLRRIHRQYGASFDAQKTVGIIVPYRNQIAMIRREIVKLGLPQLNTISIDTVERYQGSQRDVIIYSFTVRRPYQLDFLTANSFEEDGLTIDRKLNVAMTRARKQLLMTGCTPVLCQHPLFAELIRRYEIY